ncbi:heparan-alpha-glucosaminide N-acetyltransferase-like [Sinocyclocheilus grahami]|uniref:heparan-alpha-glucosaminide N-acetyltransferase-like n=1 Tax=Sinocyclocheilus grahami TaxID=75366 RepID=UPI0007ACD59B|nr:PREDICTED: heparan-alpha-glucosaminide N-acetyltransferase-like [Sinocyclocheilus grahami]
MYRLNVNALEVFYRPLLQCLYQPLATVGNGQSNISVVVSTQFTLTLKIAPVDGNGTLCSLSQTFEEAGHYSLWMRQSELLNDVTCSLTVDRSPNNAYLPLLAAFLILASITVFWASLPYILRCSCTQRLKNRICRRRSQNSIEMDEAINEHSVDKSKSKSSRLKSLDTIRGLSLTVMVFVNYGGGGYWFFQHAPWNGLTVANLVMPWFVFIIGTSVVLAFTSMHRKGAPWLQLLCKVTWRTIVLMLIGFCFMNYSPKDGYCDILVLATDTRSVPPFGFHIFCPGTDQNWWNPIQDLVLHWPEWIFIVLLETMWLHLTFLLPVPNCPTGYSGTGDIGDDGLYPNCTERAATYIDRWLFGDNIFWYPTCKVLYRTTEPFGPEGVLGTIISIVMGFFCMQAGKNLLFFRKMNKGILARFHTYMKNGISAAILSKCTRDEGFIPVNKKPWSLSFVTCMGRMSFVLLGVMYFIVDIKEWCGQPFIYPRMNSIFVYVGHSLLGFYFPFSWEIRFQDSHWEQLFQSIWGTALWVFIAYLLYRKKKKK